ncbi:Serine/threonine-protein kinase samkB [Quillaja saponaria]|uniref:Serine/threonine-protein kinase samkB n=1 Tax=Quillaja saponaria TaxID=32244 RepID=A0AAD7L3Q7_QUISA|nr:Serine/threonine-protein kinase samkB [Quillaja saponaria]
MGPDLELKMKSESALDISVVTGNVIVPVVPEVEVLSHEFNHKIHASGMDALVVEKAAPSNENEDVEVNIIDYARLSNVFPVEVVQKDVTESSNSFGDTEFQTENELILSDTEVESRLHDSNESPLIFDGWREPFRISSDQDLASPPKVENRFTVRSPYTASQHECEFSMGDVLTPESFVASDEEMAPLCTIGTTDQPRACEYGVLIQSEPANEKLYAVEESRSLLMQKPQELSEELKTNLPGHVSEPDLPSENAVPVVQSTMKSLSASKSNSPRNPRSRKRKIG